MTKKPRNLATPRLPAIIDRQISDQLNDAFGHRHFAVALRHLVESPENTPPFSIGLLGGWGTGKSTVKEIYERNLRNDVARLKRIKTVTFNAWRFGGDSSIKRALLKHVYLELDGDATELERSLYQQTERDHSILKNPRKFFGELNDIFFGRWAVPLAAFLGVLFLLAAAFPISSFILGRLYDFDVPWQHVSLWAIVTGLFAIASRFVPFNRFFPALHSRFSTVQAPKESAEQFEDLLIDQFCAFKRQNASFERLIIFVDDLDRLGAEEMVDGLDAIRAFMELPCKRLPSGLGIIFVVSCDEALVAHALADRRHKLHSDMLATVSTERQARRFLDRIFQFRLELPPFPRNDVKAFVRSHINKSCPDVVSRISELGHDLELVIDQIGHDMVDTPREALQTLNAFLYCWWLANIREAEVGSENRTGALAQGAVTAHPVSLAILCGLKIEFPEVYADLQREPELIRRLTEVAFQGRNLTDLPPVFQEVLPKYFHSNDRLAEMKDRGLRQFLARIQNHQWPENLLPLLLLSEDPISRRYGSGNLKLRSALINQDERGLLEELGHAHDDKQFGREVLARLKDVLDHIAKEDSQAQHRCAYVMAKLAPRVPPREAKTILLPLYRQLTKDHDLRWILGVDGMRNLLEHAPIPDRKKVAETLLSDLEDGGAALRTSPARGKPNQDEGERIAIDLINLVLYVVDEADLSQERMTVLRIWLLERKLIFGKNPVILRFQHLFTWVKKHPRLLSDLNIDYTDQLCSGIEAKKLSTEDETIAIQHFSKVFTAEREKGEDYRPDVWEQLTRLVGFPPERIVLFAAQYWKDFSDEPPADKSDAFIAKFARRLIKDLAEEGWVLENWRDAYLLFFDLLECYKKRFTEETVNALNELASEWAIVDGTEESATRLAAFLVNRAEENASSFIQNWIKEIISKLRPECVEWLAFSASRGTLDDSQLAEIISQFAFAHTAKKHDEEHVAQLKLFTENLTSQDLPEKLRSFYEGLLKSINQHFQNHDYVKQMFPIVVAASQFSSKQSYGQVLQTLFSQTNCPVDQIVFLHEIIRETWPEPSDELGPYNPESIFVAQLRFATNNISNPKIETIFRSLEAILKLGLVSSSVSSEVLNSAKQLWPKRKDIATFMINAASIQPKVDDLISFSERLNDSDDLRYLQEVWSFLLQDADDEMVVGLGSSLLQTESKTVGEKSDAIFSVFCESVGERMSAVLVTIIDKVELSDESAHRVWLQVERYIEQFQTQQLLPIVEKIARTSEWNAAFMAVTNFRSQLNDLCQSVADRQALAKVCLEAALGSKLKDRKESLVEWSAKLDGDAALEEVDLSSLPDIDFQIIGRYFASNKHIKRLRKRKIGRREGEV